MYRVFHKLAISVNTVASGSTHKTC